jgi:hypothetical protein
MPLPMHTSSCCGVAQLEAVCLGLSRVGCSWGRAETGEGVLTCGHSCCGEPGSAHHVRP